MIRVFLDANVLFKKILLTIFLDMAENKVITFLWSQEVLAEFSKNRKKYGSKSANIKSICSNIATHFHFGEITKRDYIKTEKNLSKTNLKDRHILAAAAESGANYLITFNTSDFSKSEAKALKLSVIHPDDFLSLLAENNIAALLNSIKLSRTRLKNPPTTEVEFLEYLRKADVSNFASNLSNHINNF